MYNQRPCKEAVKCPPFCKIWAQRLSTQAKKRKNQDKSSESKWNDSSPRLLSRVCFAGTFLLRHRVVKVSSYFGGGGPFFCLCFKLKQLKTVLWPPDTQRTFQNTAFKDCAHERPVSMSQRRTQQKESLGNAIKVVFNDFLRRASIFWQMV